MGFKKFSFLLIIRLAFIMLTLMGVSQLIIIPGYHAATLLVSGVLIFQAFEVYQFVKRTNEELSRFLDAARYADFSQRFRMHQLGAGFGELGEAFTDILTRFQSARSTQEMEYRHLKALVEHVPVPLLSIEMSGAVQIWNNAARRLFGNVHVAQSADLSQFGDTFEKEATAMKAGERRLISFKTEDLDQKVMLQATQVTIDGRVEKLISIQNIQSELDAAQLQAWQDLVRVLTHEIMNSITPVASLAKTAVDLVDDVAGKVSDKDDVLEELADVKDAVNTVARRSDKLNQFVSSYRSLTRLPPPDKKRVRIADIFEQMETLFKAKWNNDGPELNTIIDPDELDVFADREMLDQVLINMLQNAEQALVDIPDAALTLSARLNKRGHVVMEISDNGNGIDDEIAERIFVPFFTTKREGSGVGLALARQVMIAHGGTISVAKNNHGGAVFTLTF